MPSSALRVIADQESLQLFFAIVTKNGIGSKDLKVIPIHLILIRVLKHLSKLYYFQLASQ